MQGTFIFVGHAFGQFEGQNYDNVKLSDGIRVFSVRNKTGKSGFEDKGFIPEKSKVVATFRITSKKEVASVELIDLSLAK